jgi:hypothetical protein
MGCFGALRRKSFRASHFTGCSTLHSLEAPLDVYSIVDVESPSLLRLAAQDMRPPKMPPGPAEDPQGWIQSKEARFTGILFQKIAVDIECQVSDRSYSCFLLFISAYKLYIATPLRYQPGDIIPVHIELRANSAMDGVLSQALDILSKHPSVLVSLTQSATYLKKGKRDVKKSDAVDASSKAPVAMAVTWPGTSGQQESDERARCVRGEIRIPAELSASFAFGRLLVEVRVSTLVPILFDF